MKPQDTVDKLQPLLEKDLSQMDIEVVDIEFRKDNGRWIFRVFIDHPDGVTHDTCQAASEVINDVLDREDIIKQFYFLEVSSPGLDRVIKKDSDFARFGGQKVKVKAKAPINGQKNFVGILKGLDGDSIVLDLEDRTVRIPRGETSQVRLVVEF
ncbi:MAG: ribosome maturation factor RimP [Candidatus Saccharibacteria bacterium]